MYSAGAIGYAGGAAVAGAMQRAASPSVAILVGVGLTVLLIAASALGELRRRPAAEAGH